MAVSFQPQYRVVGTPGWTDFGSTISAMTCTVTGLTNVTNYEFRIVATDSPFTAISDILPASTAGATQFSTQYSTQFG